jgi:hypothetical protein
MLARNPQKPLLPKAEGMIRFYLDGKRPPREQEWPDCLAVHKDEWLKAIQDGVLT